MDKRLKKSDDFDRVFKKGNKAYSKNLTMIYLCEKCLKVGFAVGKKHGGSVKRNRIKRLLREAFRTIEPSIDGNFFFVFIPRLAEEYTLGGFISSMQYLLKKSGIVKCSDQLPSKR